MKLNIAVETQISTSARVKQLGSLFDCPVEEKTRLSWSGDFPYDGEPWNIGLIVGPSGAGKSTILREVFGTPAEFEWNGNSVIDDFRTGMSLQDISEICRAVGFNTIPAWMRPYRVLSNGERFRVELARRLSEDTDPVVVDEFTSIVDRQVAQIGAHAIQKLVRKRGRHFVAASCHHDVIDWLQPDWILEPATMTFTRRVLRRRPELGITISKVPYAAWRIFAPFHYMSPELSHAAQCFGLFVDDTIASFIGILHFPHDKVKNLKRVSRIVTHPDWQGLGFGPILADTVASAYKALGFRFRNYPAHPSYVRTIAAATTKWVVTKMPGTFQAKRGEKSSVGHWHQGNRPCAVFEYIGEPMDLAQARRLVSTS